MSGGDLASRLLQRVTLQSASLTPDGSGGGSTIWADVATMFAEVVPLSGSEQWNAMRLQSSISHRVTLRHRAGVTAAMRVLYGSRIFNIRAVVNVAERGEVLELLCEEGVGA